MQENAIPLLTEVIEVADIAPDVAPYVAPYVAAYIAPNVAPNAAQNVAQNVGQFGRPGGISAAPPGHNAPAAADIAPPIQLDLEQLQAKLTEQVLRQLQGRIDFVLEQRIRDSLADVLQLAMIGLTNDIKRGLQHTLEEVIGRAVAQELAKLQHPKK